MMGSLSNQDAAVSSSNDSDGNSSASAPTGGTDRTSLPDNIPPGWNVKITIHGATGLPPADINTLSCDPYVEASIRRHNLPQRHPEDSQPSYRTSAIPRSINPVWESSWLLGNCPGSGFQIKCRVMDEDPNDSDDRLGNAYVDVKGPLQPTSSLHRQEYSILKRKGSWRAYGAKAVLQAFASSHHESRGRLCVSVEVLERTTARSGAKMFTIGPNYCFQHYSPLIGRIAGTKGTSSSDGGIERYDFEANQMQLTGPVPDELYQRYVAFKSWVQPMFTSAGFRGKTLAFILKKQHSRIYNFDRKTHHICIDQPGRPLALQLLRMAHYDQGGRVFTYVILLDGLLRFTETGKEFGIDLLSKHTMHAQVEPYTAFSGEFFIRRVTNPKTRDKPLEEQAAHPPDALASGPPHEDPPEDPSLFEIIVDNDSGTYRPAADLLPILQDFLQSNFHPLRVVAMAADDKELQRLKQQQHSAKAAEGDGRVFVQPDQSSDSQEDDSSAISSAEESLDERIQALEQESKSGEGFSSKQQLKNFAHQPKSTFKLWRQKHHKLRKL